MGYHSLAKTLDQEWRSTRKGGHRRAQTVKQGVERGPTPGWWSMVVPGGLGSE